MNKNSDFIKIIKAAGVYTGIVLGAGFASGQEIIKFFVGYGSRGFLGLILAGIVLALTGWSVMDICSRLQIKNYNHFIETVFGKSWGIIVNWVSSLFICILFCAMLAGTGEMCLQSFDVPFTIGVIAIGIVCFITFIFDIKGIIQVNVILAPLLVAGGIFFGLYTFFTEYTTAFNFLDDFLKSNWVFAALTYASYNIITAINVLSEMDEVVTSRKIAKYAGIGGGLCLTLLGICFALPLMLDSSLINIELPMLSIARNHGKIIEVLYIFILLASILTTAVSNGFAAVEWLHARLKINKFIIKIIVVTFGIMFAHIGFSNFVGRIYPIFGIIGLFEIIMVITYFLSGEKNKKESNILTN